MSDGPDLNPHNLLNILLHHLEVPAGFIPGALLLGGAAWYLAPRRGWDRVPAVLAGCALAMALALTVVRPPGHFPAGGLNPLATVRLCSVGSLSLAHLYEQLNVLMLIPFAVFATVAARRPVPVVIACLLVSAGVEFVQAATGGGQCQARDIAHNTLGGLLGVLAAMALLAWRGSRSRGLTEDTEVGAGSSR
ncbi:MAG TPA: VanZ family protein [Pseudonocardiaceae bacterium]|nr:VanZ family protein [Pseudonocardiaceae bacterium]